MTWLAKILRIWRKLHEAKANHAFGLWGERKRDGLVYQEATRREWVGRAWD
jgi:hypothetical protein